MTKNNNSINSISPKYDNNDCHPNKANVNISNKPDDTFKNKTIDQPLLNNGGTSNDTFNSFVGVRILHDSI